MQSNIHWLRMDVCDYTDKPLCNLYDSDRDVSGQAVEVFIHSERNGFKELSFQLPSVCFTENGEEKNYRLDYLVSDYKIKIQKSLANNDEIETDWFLISETRVSHKAFSENYEIKARHVSSLLNIKKLDLEFSEDEGNNVGTIEQIAATILEGTGWHLGEVAEFYEEKKYGQPENTPKVRSFSSSVQTGAFKMLSDLCELFDAKPIYHGAGKYQSYKVVGINSQEEEIIYKTNCDIYEATKAKDLAEQSGLNDVQIVDNGFIIGKIVDILPMNPFSEDYEEGTIPKNIIKDKIIELYYNKNIKEITRTLNTENLITKLSAYGSYGDRNGLCSLQKATHTVITFPDVEAGAEYKFEFNSAFYYFTADEDASGLKWSSLDFVSRSYVYNGTNLFKVYKTPQSSSAITITFDAVEETNYLPFVMDFSYYQKIGLLTDDMLRELAEFQTEIPQKYIEAEQASYALSQVKTELLKTASASNGFLRFAIDQGSVSSNPDDLSFNQLVLRLDKSEYDDGIIFRSDYDEAKRNYFSWNVASDIKKKGEAIAGKGGVVYIVRQSENSQTSWTKAYVKMIGNENGIFFYDDIGNYYTLKNKQRYDPLSAGDPNVAYVDEDSGKIYAWNQNNYNEIKPCDYTYGLNYFDEPSLIVLWCSENAWTEGDIVYLFSSDSVAGMFGPREDSIKSNKEAIEKSTQVSTEIHPMYFINETAPMPALDSALLGYGWCYRSYDDTFELGDLYFCWGTSGTLNWTENYEYVPDDSQAKDTDWIKVYISKGSENPEINPNVLPGEYGYYYNYKLQNLYKNIDGSWEPLNGTLKDSLDIRNAFKAVLRGCITQEILTKGLKEQYYHDITSTDLVNGVFPIGNYAFKNEFDNYWLFTTDMVLGENDRLRYYPANKIVWQDTDEHHVLYSIEHSFDILDFPKENEIFGITFNRGSYDHSTHTISTDGSSWISNNILIHENTVYECELPTGFTIVLYDTNAKVIAEYTTDTFTTQNNGSYIRIVLDSEPLDTNWIHVKGYDSCFFTKNKQYKILNCQSTGERTGIYYLMDKFVSLSNQAYNVELPKLRTAQDAISHANIDLSNILGDMYREGYWQQNDYVEGDEYKLYVDALDNLKEISHPEATYDISYIDLYEADKNIGLSVIDGTETISYPDVDISFAAHLVDPDIDVNCWAYIDKIDTCYDQPWKTNIEINTKLSMIGQQSFTDVLAHIAEVATETKANQTIYKRAIGLSSNGSLEGNKLEGSLETGKIYLIGGTSNWYTDEKGNIIFESADSASAIMLTGRGILTSQEKDEYGDWLWHTAITGKGLDNNLDISNNTTIINMQNEIQSIKDKAFITPTSELIVLDYVTYQDIEEICI